MAGKTKQKKKRQQKLFLYANSIRPELAFLAQENEHPKRVNTMLKAFSSSFWGMGTNDRKLGKNRCLISLLERLKTGAG